MVLRLACAGGAASQDPVRVNRWVSCSGTRCARVQTRSTQRRMVHACSRLTGGLFRDACLPVVCAAARLLGLQPILSHRGVELTLGIRTSCRWWAPASGPERPGRRHGPKVANGQAGSSRPSSRHLPAEIEAPEVAPDRRAAVVDWVRQQSDWLAAFGLPETLVHGDFHVFARATGMALRVTHPTRLHGSGRSIAADRTTNTPFG